MTSAHFEFFLTPQESKELIDRLQANKDIVLLRERWKDHPLLPLGTGDDLNYEAGHRDRPERLFVATESIGDIEVDDEHPAFEHGMVMLDLPGRDKNDFLMGALNYKTSPAKAQVAKLLFNKIKEELKHSAGKKLSVRSTDGSAVRADSARASARVAELAKEGATLRQRGIPGQEFVISE
jgi:hypothetical protein